MINYPANTILHDGKEGFKLVQIEIPPMCVSLKDDNNLYILSYNMRNGIKPYKTESYPAVHNTTPIIYPNLLTDFHGVVIPGKDVSSSWYNGRNLAKAEGIFTRDKRIFLTQEYDESDLETVIRRIISIFTLNRWQDLFEAHFNSKRII